MKMHGAKGILLCAAGFCAVSAWFLSVPNARTWQVKEDGSGDAPTIQAAVDSSAAGDSILVAAGKYFDTHDVLIDAEWKRVNLHLYKNVRVVGRDGAEKTMIKAYSSDIGVYIDGVDSTAELSRFIIETSWIGYSCVDTSGIDPWNMPAAVEARGSSALIADNLIRYNDVGIRLRASDAAIRNNEIHNNGVSIFAVEGSGAIIAGNALHDAMYLIQCGNSSPAISGNELRKACVGIATTGNSNPHILDNLIHFIWSWAVDCRSGATIEANRFAGNASAVRLSGGAGPPVVRSNLFFQNVFGVEITAPSPVQIENNTFDACDFAIYGEGEANAAISRNVIVRPGIGISCSGACSLDVDCNDIFDALIALYDAGCGDRTGIDGNISRDPEFCGIAGSGNYFLQSDSPCAPGNHPEGIDCGRIGAYPVNCGMVPVAEQSWGTIKRLFAK